MLKSYCSVRVEKRPERTEIKVSAYHYATAVLELLSTGVNTSN